MGRNWGTLGGAQRVTGGSWGTTGGHPEPWAPQSRRQPPVRPGAGRGSATERPPQSHESSLGVSTRFFWLFLALCRVTASGRSLRLCWGGSSWHSFRRQSRKKKDALLWCDGNGQTALVSTPRPTRFKPRHRVEGLNFISHRELLRLREKILSSRASACVRGGCCFP